MNWRSMLALYSGNEKDYWKEKLIEIDRRHKGSEKMYKILTIVTWLIATAHTYLIIYNAEDTLGIITYITAILAYTYIAVTRPGMNKTYIQLIEEVKKRIRG